MITLEIRKNISTFLPVLLFLLPFLPALIYGERTLFVINDVLDSNQVLYSIMGGQIPGAELKDGIYPSIMDGLPESGLPSRISIITLCYALFSPFTAWFVNLLLIRGVAFAGMYLLLTRTFKVDNSRALWMGACFSLLPFFPFGGISVAGLPLLFQTILDLRKGQRKTLGWLTLAIFPFYSNLVWVGIIILPLIGIWFCYDSLKTKKPDWIFIVVGILLTAGYMISEYALIKEALLSPSYISHRTEFSMYSFMYPVSFPWAILMGWDEFVNAQEHTLSLHFPILFLLIPLYLIIRSRKRDTSWRQIFLLFVFTGSISLLYGLLYWSPLARIMEKWEIFRLIDLSRAYFLQPFLWYLLFFLVLEAVITFSYGKYISYTLIGMQCCWLLWNDPALQTFRKTGDGKNLCSYEQYYSKKIYSNLKHTKLNLSPYERVACLGISPGIAQMNGLHTIDGYVSNYPLEYKHRFRKIIAGELEKDERLKKYFDHWGSRCYLFNAVTGRDMHVRSDEVDSLPPLSLDISAMNELGAKYLLSSVKISEETSGLFFSGLFQEPENPYKVFVYSISNATGK